MVAFEGDVREDDATCVSVRKGNSSIDARQEALVIAPDLSQDFALAKGYVFSTGQWMSITLRPARVSAPSYISTSTQAIERFATMSSLSATAPPTSLVA